MNDEKERHAARLFINRIKQYVNLGTEYNEKTFSELVKEKLQEAIDEVDSTLDSNIIYLLAKQELVDLEIQRLKKVVEARDKK